MIFRSDRTLEEFLEMIRPEGCHYHEIPGIYGPRGPARSRYITRTVDGKTLIAHLPNMSDDAPLFDHVAKSILRNLELDPAVFGYGRSGRA